MRARKIPPGRRVPTCRFYSDINGRLIDCESPLERDFYQTLEAEHKIIQHYQEQPFPVPNDIKGRGKPLFPDCLVTYKLNARKKPLLVEVKSEKDLRDPEKAPDIKRKIKILRAYAVSHGMNFKVVLDTDIRGPRLDNLKFLYQYSRPRQFTDKYRTPILRGIKAGKEMTVNQILDALAGDRQERAYILPVIWHLLWIKELKADLNELLTNGTLLRVKK